MPFSSKAQEIHDHIVSTGKADYWIGVAKLLADRRGQHRPGKPYSRCELSPGECAAFDERTNNVIAAARSSFWIDTRRE
jgi:hypothetical protein